MEHEILEARNERDHTIARLQDVEVKYSQLQQDMNRCQFFPSKYVLLSWMSILSRILWQQLVFSVVCIYIRIQKFFIYYFSIEEKLSNLERENHVLRQTAISLSPRLGVYTKTISEVIFSYALANFSFLYNVLVLLFKLISGIRNIYIVL